MQLVHSTAKADWAKIVYCHILDTRWGSLSPIRRLGLSNLQPQPTGPRLLSATSWALVGSLTPLQRCSWCILQHQPIGPGSFTVIARTFVGGVLTPVQRCSRCILQRRPTGQDGHRKNWMKPFSLLTQNVWWEWWWERAIWPWNKAAIYSSFCWHWIGYALTEIS